MLDRAASGLFGNGFWFMAPYVAAYLAGRAFDLPTSSLLTVCLALHALNLVLLSAWAWPRVRRADPRLIAFWVALTLLFLLPGAYLEFPSDPWEHVRRIYGWSTVVRIDDHGTGEKFAYFWGWTWLGFLPIGWRAAGLAVYATFWQLLLAAAFYRLARALGFGRGWSAAQVVGTVALFGTSLFSFYRIYALSSTPLAYIAYLYVLTELLRADRPRARDLAISMAVAAVVVWANHAQELLFLAIVVPALLAFDRISALSVPRKTRVAVLAAAVFLGSLGLGIWLRARHPALYLGNDAGIGWLGVYRLWDAHAIFFETLGLHGWLGVLAACAIARGRPRLAFLTLLPVGLLVFPPFVLAASRLLPDGHIVYRMLYAFPSSLALIAAMAALKGPLPVRGLVAVGLAGISLIPAWPLRGRLYFQLYVPPAANRLTHLYPVASEVARHATFTRDCLIVSDRITNFFLSAHLGLRPRVGRFEPDLLLDRWLAGPSLDVFTAEGAPAPICAAVLLRPDQVPRSPGSWIGRSSRHWTDRESIHRAWVRADYSTALARINEAQWWPIGSAVWLNPKAVALGLATPRQAGADLQR
jgi:hypothetical protein